MWQRLRAGGHGASTPPPAQSRKNSIPKELPKAGDHRQRRRMPDRSVRAHRLKRGGMSSGPPRLPPSRRVHPECARLLGHDVEQVPPPPSPKLMLDVGSSRETQRRPNASIIVIDASWKKPSMSSPDMFGQVCHLRRTWIRIGDGKRPKRESGLTANRPPLSRGQKNPSLLKQT